MASHRFSLFPAYYFTGIYLGKTGGGGSGGKLVFCAFTQILCPCEWVLIDRKILKPWVLEKLRVAVVIYLLF